jgi:perosamine synthetase
MIPVYKPYLTKDILKYAHDALDSTWISSKGDYLNKVKDKLKEILNVKYVILTNNGTCANHLMACGLKYKYPEIEYLFVSNNCYIEAYNPFQINPIYNILPIDVNIDTWNFDYSNLRDSDWYKDKAAFLLVHNISGISSPPPKDYIFIEDNCEGFLGKYDGVYTGTKSLISTASFYGNKTLTSGEGGLICTQDEDIFEYLNTLRTHGVSSDKFVFDSLGFNYRMTNIQAALLYGQLEYIHEIKDRKHHIFELYKKELQDIKNIKFQETDKNTEASEWMFGFRIEDITESKRKELELYLYHHDIETRTMFPPINYHKHYNWFAGKIKNAKIIYDSTIILPSYPELQDNQIKYISKIIKKFII